MHHDCFIFVLRNIELITSSGDFVRNPINFSLDKLKLLLFLSTISLDNKKLFAIIFKICVLFINNRRILRKSTFHDKFTIANFADLTSFNRNFIGLCGFINLEFSFFIEAILTRLAATKIAIDQIFSFFA